MFWGNIMRFFDLRRSYQTFLILHSRALFAVFERDRCTLLQRNKRRQRIAYRVHSLSRQGFSTFLSTIVSVELKLNKTVLQEKYSFSTDYYEFTHSFCFWFYSEGHKQKCEVQL